MKETVDQLKEFQSFLEKATKGNMSLVDEFGAAQLVSLRCSFFALVHNVCLSFAGDSGRD